MRDARLRRLEEESEEAPRDRPPIVVKTDSDLKFLEAFKAEVTAWLAVR